nr:response regulator transcription factor [Desulfobacula sp.]
MPDKKQICIIDDHPVFRKGLAQLINEEQDLEVTGEAGTVEAAIRMISESRPDLAVIDLTLKDQSGLELIDYLTRHFTGLPMLVVSMHDESLYAERVLRAGAMGYITKQEMADNVVAAIRQVLKGKRYVSADMVDLLLGRLSMATPEQGQNPVAALSGREFEVFRMMGRGLKRREMAEQLHLSVKTIGTYRESIKKKLGLKSAAQLMKHAVAFTQKKP